MTRFQRYILKRIAASVVKQGWHRKRIIEFYHILIEAARKEFTEDNEPTLDSFLTECHQEALNKPEDRR